MSAGQQGRIGGGAHGSVSRTCDRGACFCSHRAGGAGEFLRGSTNNWVPAAKWDRRCCCSLLKRLESIFVLSSCKEVLLFSFKTAGINPAQLC